MMIALFVLNTVLSAVGLWWVRRRLHRGILEAIEAKRALRMAEDADLCAWLIRWDDAARENIAIMRQLVADFNEALGPYTAPADDGGPSN